MLVYIQRQRCKQCLCIYKGNGASNAFVPTNTKNHPNRWCGSGVFFCLLRLPPQALANKNVLGNDPFQIGCSIDNRLGEQVRSQKVYSEKRKSRDNTTVNFDRLTWGVLIDRMYSNIISKMGFLKKLSQKIPHPCADVEQLVH